MLHRRATSADLLATALRRRSDQVCFVMGDHQLRYREVRNMVFAAARAFATMGLRRGDGVGCLSGNRPDAWVAAVGAQMAGCRYTPLNAKASTDDLVHIAADAELSLVVFDPAFEEIAQKVGASVGCRLTPLGDAGPTSLLALAERESGAAFEPDVDEADLAVLAYTGGTTGRPKGVMLPHRSTVANAMMTVADWELPRELRVLLCTPLSHSAGTMALPTLLRGGTIHLLDGFDPEEFLATIERERVTCTLGVPTLIYTLLDHPALGSHDVSSLETFIYGSSPMSPARLEEALDRLGSIFMQLYGQTEAPNTVTMLPRADHDPARPHLLASCGQPMAGVRVALLDGDDQPVAPGAEGEICVRGPLVMDGYWRNDEATASTLRNGWLHTGDVARQDDDGYLYIVDRLKDVVITGGFNVYPREVEDALTSHAAVASAAVIGVPDPKWGEAVKAFVVLRPGHDAAEEDLRSFVRDLKGPVQTPKSVEFLDAMPQTPVGKPDKVALRKRYWAGEARQVG